MSFWVCGGPDLNGAILELCRLIDEYYKNGQYLYLNMPDADVSDLLDAKLWTFKDISFIPHAKADQCLPDCPVIIGHSSSLSPNILANCKDRMLINCSIDIPAFWDEFNGIVDIVYSDESAKAIARRRYRRYQQLGAIVTMLQQDNGD